MIKNFYYSFFLLILSCSVIEKGSSGVFFAGEIVNPTDKYVVLYKNEVAIDSALLNEYNMFSIELSTIEDGLYHFNHNPELQYVFLEKGDSLLVRLNTVDFDESLIFAGKGEEINNFLLEVFLKEEEEEPLINASYVLEQKEFSFKIDSLRERKINLLNELLSQLNLSNNALEIARASIDYNSYISKEKYPFYHKKRTGKDTIPKLDEDFYKYRDNISYNNKNLTYFRPYYNFMKYHFGNLSYMTCNHDCDFTKENEFRNKLHYSKHTLKLIDSLVQEKNLRDNLFRNVAMDYLLKVRDNMENNKLFINEFLKLSGNNQHIAEINKLYDGIKSMQPNNELPNLEVYTVEGEEITLAEIADNENVVFYFWSATQIKHFERLTIYLEELRMKYPDYKFVGVNWNTNKEKWISLMDAKRLDRDQQYRTENFDELAKTLIFDDFNKVIIAKNGFIVDGFANLYTSFKVK